MKWLLFIGLIGVFSFTSCKKGKANFVLKGTITDQTLGGNLDGASVTLYATPAGGGNESTIAQATIGSDGAYSFTFPRDKVEAYRIFISKNLYFDIEQTISFSDLTTESDNVRNFSSTAMSWAKLRFTNSFPQPGEELHYHKQLGKEGCVECCPTGNQILVGAVDTAIYCINDGNTDYSYFYTVVGSANPNQGVKTVTTVPFDTTELILNY